jgi:hypothetical protein
MFVWSGEVYYVPISPEEDALSEPLGFTVDDIGGE